MVAGHLREKRGYYHIVLSYTDENGKRQTPSKSTGLPIKGNKKRAEAMLQEARRTMEAELQLRQMEREKGYTDNPADILFTRFLLDWLEMMKASVEITTYFRFFFSNAFMVFSTSKVPWSIIPISSARSEISERI